MSPTPPPFRRRVRLLVGGLCLLIVAGQGWAAREAYRSASRAREAEVLGVARTTAAALEQFLAVARRSTASLAERRGTELLTSAGCQREIPALADAFPFFANLFVVDADGALVCSGLELPRAPVSAAERAWFQELAAGGEFSVGRPVMGPVSDTWVVAMGSAIRDAQGALEGAVGGSVALLRLEEILLEPGPSPHELVTITTDEGVVVARSADAESWVGRPLPEGTVDVERHGPRLLLTRAEDATGLARVWGRVDLPEVGLRVYTGVPAARIQDPSLADFRRHAVVAAVLLGLALLLSVTLLFGGAPPSEPAPNPDQEPAP